jgi:gliding motility-associated-like protein
LATIPAHENTFTANLATDAFEHRYVVRALEKEGVNESWSSALSFEFKHPVTIPNIITPNGDEFNQFFHISKIQLYRNSELTILDRWGKEVFHTVNYQNDWDGGGVSSGVYFYILDLKKDNKVYKGPLTIL